MPPTRYELTDAPWDVYAVQAASGKLICSKWVRLAGKRYLDDLKHGHKRGIWFDVKAAKRAIDFFKFLRHSKGEWAGQEVKLEPWQQFIIAMIFGWKRADGTRRFRTVHVEVAKKNGKSTVCAGIGLYLLLADGEPGAEVYCAATKKDQARIVFEEAVRMRAKSPALVKRIAKFRDNLNVPETASKFEPLGADQDTLDGPNISGLIFDELHAQKTRSLWDVLENGTAARRQPMTFAITTAGYDRESVCFAQHDYGERVVEGLVDDDSFFVFIACIDEEDDWENEANWIKANPNLSVSVKIDTLRERAAKAKEDPSSLNAFLRLRLNKWTSNETAAIRMEDWGACVGFPLAGTDPRALRRTVESQLAGRRCVLAVDLAATDDLVAELKVFEPEDSGSPYIALADFWMAKDNIERKKKEWRAPYDVWEREGWIRTTEGNVVDHTPIREQVLKDFEAFDVIELAFDPWNATQFSNDLQAAGIAAERLVKFSQTIAMFAEPTKKLLSELIPSHKIAHLANPVLAWHARNLMVWTDGNGNRRPTKKTSRAKIDGMVALIMGIGRLIATPDDGGERYTEERGVLVV